MLYAVLLSIYNVFYLLKNKSSHARHLIKFTNSAANCKNHMTSPSTSKQQAFPFQAPFLFISV